MHLFFAHYISALHVFSPSVSLHAIITLFFIWNVLSLFTFNVKLKNIEFSFINQLVSVWNLWQLIIKCKLNLNHSSGSVHGRREWRPIENGNFRRFFFRSFFRRKKWKWKWKQNHLYQFIPENLKRANIRSESGGTASGEKFHSISGTNMID